MADIPMPGQTDFTADEEKAMRAGMAAQNAQATANTQPQYMLTPKGRAMGEGMNLGSNLPDDATDRQ
jgi:hypothetical protein